MINLEADRSETFYYNAFLNSYLKGGELKDHYDFYPQPDQLEHILESRKDFPEDKRKILQEVIREQYIDSGIADPGKAVNENMESLANHNTFTITTGQQIHIGLGPLYVLYKILNVLQLSKEANESYPDFHFVPVFWMASEDHDIEEIRDVKLFGKTFTWETDQKGPVGRMNTEGIAELFNKIRSEINPGPEIQEFIELCRESYASSTLSVASRKLIHQLFKHSGLIVLDADDYRLKAQFTEVMQNELEGKHYTALQKYSDALQDKGFEPQVHIREVNLFMNSSSGRDRIVMEPENTESNGKVSAIEYDPKSYVENHYTNISPNVALRPLYQEFILPNLIYVAGPSELKYWFQLKGIFEYYHKKLPMLYLRTSALLIPEHLWTETDKDPLDFYRDEEDIVLKASKLLAEEEGELKSSLTNIKEELKHYNLLFEKAFKGYSLEGKLSKLQPKLEELASISTERMVYKAEHNPELKRLLKLKRSFFSTDSVQERVKHCIEYAAILSDLTDIQGLFGFKKLLKIHHLLIK